MNISLPITTKLRMQIGDGLAQTEGMSPNHVSFVRGALYNSHFSSIPELCK